MKICSQEDLDKFYAKALIDPKIYPYLTVAKLFDKAKLFETDWTGLHFISTNITCLLKLTFDRARDLEVGIGLWAFNPVCAGKAVNVIQDVVRMYKPRALTSCVHASNIKSLAFNKRLLGEHWGIEKSVAWNMGKGAFEDLFHFRKLL